MPLIPFMDHAPVTCLAVITGGVMTYLFADTLRSPGLVPIATLHTILSPATVGAFLKNALAQATNTAAANYLRNVIGGGGAIPAVGAPLLSMTGIDRALPTLLAVAAPPFCATLPVEPIATAAAAVLLFHLRHIERRTGSVRFLWLLLIVAFAAQLFTATVIVGLFGAVPAVGLAVRHGIWAAIMGAALVAFQRIPAIRRTKVTASFSLTERWPLYLAALLLLIIDPLQGPASNVGAVFTAPSFLSLFTFGLWSPRVMPRYANTAGVPAAILAPGAPFRLSFQLLLASVGGAVAHFLLNTTAGRRAHALLDNVHPLRRAAEALNRLFGYGHWTRIRHILAGPAAGAAGAGHVGGAAPAGAGGGGGPHDDDPELAAAIAASLADAEGQSGGSASSTAGSAAAAPPRAVAHDVPPPVSSAPRVTRLAGSEDDLALLARGGARRGRGGPAQPAGGRGGAHPHPQPHGHGPFHGASHVAHQSGPGGFSASAFSPTTLQSGEFPPPASASSAGPASPPTTVATSMEAGEPSADDAKVDLLMALGLQCTRPQAAHALQAAHGNVDDAATLLMDHH